MAALPLALVACSSDDDPSGTGAGTGNGTGGGSGDGTGCNGTCKTAGFSGGNETNFNNGLVEYQCTGTGGEVTKAACEAYCTKFNVSAADSLLSSEPGAKPAKCVCDGT